MIQEIQLKDAEKNFTDLVEKSIQGDSFVEQRSRVYHEDIPVPGTDITLNYTSSRAEGYIRDPEKTHYPTSDFRFHVIMQRPELYRQTTFRALIND